MATFSEEGIRQRWPNLMFLVNDPTAGPIIRQAYEEEWSESQFQAALSQSPWWKNRSQSQRTWETLVETDNASAHRQVEQLIPAIRSSAIRMGVDPNKLDPNTLWTLADAKLRYGWSDAEMNANLAEMIGVGGAAPGSDYSAMADKVKQIASDYMLPIDESTIAHWVKEMAKGTITFDGVKGYYKEQAVMLRPHLKSIFDQGITVRQYAQPFIGQLSNILELNPNTVELNDPRWGQIFDHFDEKIGKVRPMTLTEVATFARRQPEWGKTQNAREQAASAETAILREMGKI